jgi:signal transduction histidine kinase
MKNKLYLLVTLFSLFITTSFAQESADDIIERLRVKLNPASSDTMKYQFYKELSFQLAPIDTAKALMFARKIKTLGDSVHNYYWQGDYFERVAGVYYLTHNLDKCIEWCYKKRDFHSVKNDSAGIAESYGSMGSVTLHRNRYWESIHYYDTSIAIQKKAGVNPTRNIYLQGYCYAKSGNYEFALKNFLSTLYAQRETGSADTIRDLAAIAYTYSQINEYDKAEEYFIRAEAVCIVQEKDTTLEKRHYTHATLLNDWANMYFDLGKESQALEIIGRAIDKWAYVKAYVPLANTSDDLGIVEALVLRSKIYQKTGNDRLAMEDIQAALKVATTAGDSEILILSWQRLGEFYLEQHEFNQAREALESAWKYTSGTNLHAKQRDISTSLSETYHELGLDTKAYKYLRLSKNLSDSILNEEKLREINRLEYQYEFDKKEQEMQYEQEQDKQHIDLLERELELKRKAQLILWGGILAVVIIGTLLIIFLYTRYKSKSTLAMKQAEINRQKLIETEKTQKLLAARFMIEGQEKERERLARDLHDDLGSQLAAIKWQLENIDPQKTDFSKTHSQINDVYEDVRRISHNLMPMSLSKAGLPSALEDLSHKMSGTKKLHIDVQTIGLEKRLDSTTEITLFRVIQEAMKNILNHAEAKNVIIQLINDGNLLALTIEDDGKGFDIQDAEKASGLGLKSMKSRIEYLNGKMDIKSKVGKGTSMYVEVPIA